MPGKIGAASPKNGKAAKTGFAEKLLSVPGVSSERAFPDVRCFAAEN